VLLLSKTPARLKGALTRWLLEISDGVYVGRVNVRIRELLWLRVTEDVRRGRALMVWPAANDQGLDFRVHNHDWEAVDADGITLIRRPTLDESKHRHALESFTEMTQKQIDKAMKAWVRKHHPGTHPKSNDNPPARDYTP
jgi:CRISPR-associated protein Cas2